MYQCFTFPDYQLLPTLEEYSTLMELHITSRPPLSRLEDILSEKEIAKATLLKLSKVQNNMTTKGGLPALTTKFLIEKAQHHADKKNQKAFKAIMALLSMDCLCSQTLMTLLIWMQSRYSFS